MATGVAAVLVTGAAVGLLASPAQADVSPIVDRASTGVTADALPTVQIDGVVWSQAVVGNTVYAGGSFANARPAGAASGTNLTPRGNLLAYNLSTGQLITSFAPSLNAQVKTVTASPDGSRIYVGGSFTQADGQQRYRLAAYSTATGTLISTWHPTVDASVNSISATNDTVYVGGIFGTANGVTRTRLAAFSAATGATLAWAPTADSTVNAVQLTPDGHNLIVGGAFQKINGAPAFGLASVDAVTGASVPFAANQVVQDSGGQSAILSLSSDGTSIFGTGYIYSGGGNLEGAFSANPTTGAINWVEDCHGDSYGAFSTGSQVYIVSHEHYCANVGGFPGTNPRTYYRSTAFTAAATGTVLPNGEPGYPSFGGQPSPSMINWFPTIDAGSYTGQSQGAWTVQGNSQYVVEGGEFLHVNGTAQQGLVRFAVPSIAPDKRGPQDTSTATAPTVSAPFNSVASISWPTNWDQDNANLTYNLYRLGSSTPIYTTTAVSEFWNRPTLSYRDSGLSAGTTYTYYVSVTDPDGNRVRTANVSVTTPTTQPAATPPTDSYGKAIYGDAPALYWRMNDTTGTTAADASDYRVAGSFSGGYTLGASSPVAPGTAVTFNGLNGALASNTSYVNPTTYSEELWFKTTTTQGGKLIGFGSSQTGLSGSYDRQVYMTNSGQLIFGTFNGALNTVTSAAAYNDGLWHYVDATQGAGGMKLYVDGAQVGSNAATVSANYTGYWRVGGDNLANWPAQPSSNYFAGTIDEAAVYLSVLTPAQVRAHYKASPAATNALPTASATSSCTAKGTCSFDGSASADPDGTIASYAWDFGDGSSGTGVSPVHTYAQSGTYTATLTVTDNSGGTASTTTAVSVTIPVNQPPTAAFTPTCTNLNCAFDASASTDSDGTVASYAWAFGDNTSGSGVKPAHSYAAAGTYSVTLTVTDDQGATSTLSTSVTVSGVVTYASDAFARTTTGGWGTADTGGAWKTVGGAALFSTGNGFGTFNLNAPGAAPTATLTGVSATNVVQTVDVATNKTATGSGYYLTVRSRIVGTTAYQLKLRFLPNGVVHLIGSKVVNGTETIFREVNIPAITYTPGDVLRLKVGVTGNGTTSTLTGTVWKVGSAQPATAQFTQADTEAALQGAGAIGMAGYASGSVTNAPLALTVDNYTATSN